MNSGISEDLVNIFGFASDEIYALSGTAMYRFNGVSWSVFSGAPGGNVVWGTSGSDLYVGGGGVQGGYLFHYDGNQWIQEVTFYGFFNLFDVHGVSNTEKYAAGDEGRIYHLKDCNQNGTYEWETTEVLPGSQAVTGMWAAGINDAFCSTDEGYVYRFTGELQNGNCYQEIWNEIFSPSYTSLSGIWGFNNNKVFAYGFKTAGTYSAIFEYNGQSWREMSTQTGTTYQSMIYGIWGSDTSNVFAVGHNGLILMLGGEIPDSLIVNTTGDEPDINPGDGICDIGGAPINGRTPCTLRAAITEANLSQAEKLVTFDFPDSVIYTISPASELPEISREFNIVGTKVVTESGGHIPNIRIDGENAGGNSDGLTISFGTVANGRKCEIKNLIITNFARHGIYMSTTYENIIQNCYIGTDPFGVEGLGNGGDGIHIYESFANQVGGEFSPLGNVISGNSGNGITITGDNANTNIIENNLIGPKPDGLSALSNNLNGIFIKEDAHSNELKKNIISGNRNNGVRIQGNGVFETSDNKLTGNKIGTNINGTAGIPNSHSGVFIDNALTNVVGYDVPEDWNVISGNGQYGVLIEGQYGRGNQIAGNFIGTTTDGMNPLGNTLAGVFINGGRENHIGVTVNVPGTGLSNVISANKREGVLIQGPTATENVVAGNLIGTKTGGLEKLGNWGSGVVIESSSGNTIGGSSAIFRNIISGHGGVDGGVVIRGSASQNNKVQSNYIGLDINGINKIENLFGVKIESGLANIIGGETPGTGNIISGNEAKGVEISHSSGNKIKGNIIGLDKNGQLVNNNTQNYGLTLSSSSYNEVGGLTADEKNIISGNTLAGIDITGGERNKIQGNHIGVDTDGTNIRANYDGIRISSSDRNIIGGNKYGVTNIISGNNTGVYRSEERRVGKECRSRWSPYH